MQAVNKAEKLLVATWQNEGRMEARADSATGSPLESGRDFHSSSLFRQTSNLDHLDFTKSFTDKPEWQLILDDLASSRPSLSSCRMQRRASSSSSVINGRPAEPNLAHSQMLPQNPAVPSESTCQVLEQISKLTTVNFKESVETSQMLKPPSFPSFQKRKSETGLDPVVCFSFDTEKQLNYLYPSTTCSMSPLNSTFKFIAALCYRSYKCAPFGFGNETLWEYNEIIQNTLMLLLASLCIGRVTYDRFMSNLCVCHLLMGIYHEYHSLRYCNRPLTFPDCEGA